MTKFVLKRLAHTVIVLLGVSVMVFFLIRYLPGDPVDLMFDGGDDEATAEAIAAGREAFAEGRGLSGSLPSQYFSFLGEISRGDLGTSLFRNVSVTTLIRQTLPLTFQLAVAGQLVNMLLSFPLGMLGAAKQNSIWDRGGTALALIGTAMPNFWQGIMLILVFAVWIPIFPVSGVMDLGIDLREVTHIPVVDAVITGNWAAFKSLLMHLALPAITLGASASLVRILRSSLLEVKHQDFMDAYRARGVRERSVTLHMLRNALPTTVVIFGIRLGTIISGSVVIETVFAYQGMGWLLINGINQRDYPLVQGIVLTFTVFTALASLLTDIVHGWLDPRVKVTSSA